MFIKSPLRVSLQSVTNMIVAVFLLIVSIVNVYGENGEFSLGSFNSGLFTNVKQRQTVLINFLKKSNLGDFVALQEVWFGKDVKDITDALKDIYPYSFSGTHREDGTLKSGPACKPSEYPTLACLAYSNCLAANDYKELSRCISEKCQPDSRLSQECFTCSALSALDGGNATSIGTEKCIMSPYNFNTKGLLVLSKRPLTNMEDVDFNPKSIQFIPKGYLRVNIEGVGEVMSVHITGFDGSQDYFNINVPFLTYDEQNRREINLLLEGSCDRNKAIIMGTINAGPRIPSNSVVGIFEDNYMEFIRKGFVSGYADSVGECTYCSGNPLTGSWPTDNILDHVMTKGYKVLGARRVLPREQLSMSHHYPITVKIQV